MPTIKEFESWITTPEAAEMLGITRQGLRKRLENRVYRAANTKLGWLVDPKGDRFKDECERAKREALIREASRETREVSA